MNPETEFCVHIKLSAGGKKLIHKQPLKTSRLFVFLFPKFKPIVPHLTSRGQCCIMSALTARVQSLDGRPGVFTICCAFTSHQTELCFVFILTRFLFLFKRNKNKTGHTVSVIRLAHLLLIRAWTCVVLRFEPKTDTQNQVIQNG